MTDFAFHHARRPLDANAAYFDRCDRMVRLAAKHGLLAMLDSD